MNWVHFFGSLTLSPAFSKSPSSFTRLYPAKTAETAERHTLGCNRLARASIRHQRKMQRSRCAGADEKKRGLLTASAGFDPGLRASTSQVDWEKRETTDAMTCTHIEPCIAGLLHTLMHTAYASTRQAPWKSAARPCRN